MAVVPERKTRIRTRGAREYSFARQIFRGIVKLVVFFCVLGLVWYGTRLDFFTIQTVTIKGGETISHDDIRATVETELQGNFFLLVPKRFSYLYPHDRITEVLEKMPRLYDISVTRASRTELTVSFREHLPHALWCLASREDVPCYFLTSEGYAFEESPHLQGGIFVRHYLESTDEKISRGSVIDRDRLHAIDTFMGRLEDELGFRVASLLYRMDGDIVFRINGGGEILATGGKDFDISFENLKAVLTSKSFSHIAPGNFNYIDVRFDNKAFVKEEFEIITEDTATGTEMLP